MAQNPDELTETPSKKRRRSGPKMGASETFDAAVSTRVSRMAGAQRPLPMFPTTADDLAAQWKVSTDDAWGVSVKLSRQRPGTNDVELVADIPLLEYKLATIAGKYGPGMYFISGAAGKYAHNAAKMMISDDFARASGFGRVPQTAQDVKALQTLQAASQGPVDPVDLLATMERMLDRKLAEARMTAPQTAQAPIDPFGNMGMMFKGFELFSAMQEKVLATAERQAAMLAGKVAAGGDAADADGDGSFMSMFTKILTSDAGAAIVQRLMAPTATQAAPAAPVLHHAPTATQAAPAAPSGAPMANLPSITAEEARAIQLFVGNLKPYAAQLAAAGKVDTRTPEDAADELFGFVAPAAYESLGALSDLVKAKGVEVLGTIHPDMATERWAATLHRMADIAREP